ncbi:hypothetical protein PRNP1_011887 [Phytophthora ramorum]
MAFATALDADLQTSLSSGALQTLLPSLDDFLTRGTALQSLRDGDEAQSGARALSTDARAVFSLFLRLADVPELLQQAADGGLLHVVRLVPFCQIYAPKNAASVSKLLEAVVKNVPAFTTTLGVLRQLYIQQLNDLHARVQQGKRNQVVELIHGCYEVVLSVMGMVTATSVADVLLLDGKDLEAELMLQEQSLLYGLVQCYEADLPALQKQLSTFDDKVALQKQPVIAETRHAFLTVLGRGVDVIFDKQKTTSTGEEVLAGLHALSNGCLEDDAEHGSFLSDLWHLCEYKDKVAELFDQCKLDLENFSYLDMVIEELPRRRILPTMLVDELAAETKPKVVLSADAKEWEASEDQAAVEEAKPTAPQNDDVETVLAPMVNQVRDFFPDLGEGYVELCLLSSNLQVEAVINFLLESNPPPVLLDAPHDLKRSDVEFRRLEAQITGKPAPAPKVEESKKLDPSRVWVGKKSMEKTYDPQIAKKDQQLVEKMKQLVEMYEEEDEDGMLPSSEGHYGGGDDGVTTLDEYDDDYNDEFDDFVPFSIRDGGSADDQDAIREQNRRMRVKEEKDAFWEGMKNRNRDNPVNAAQHDKDEEGEEKEENPGELKSWRSNPTAGPSQQGSSGPSHKSTRRKDKRQEPTEKKPDEALTPQQIQRQRARKDKNKAKVANHNRKDRAMKKMG